MSSTLQLIERIGQAAVWQGMDALDFQVKIIDATKAYGRTRYLVTPVAGTGARWVDETKLTFLVEVPNVK